MHRRLPTVAADLLAGVCPAAQIQLHGQRWHSHRGPLPNHPRHGDFSRVGAVQFFQILIGEPGDGHAFSNQLPASALSAPNAPGGAEAKH